MNNGCLIPEEDPAMESQPPQRSPGLSPRLSSLSTSSFDTTISASPELNTWSLDDGSTADFRGLIDGQSFISSIEQAACGHLSQQEVLTQIATAQLPNCQLDVQLTNPDGSLIDHSFKDAFSTVMTVVASTETPGGHAVRVRAWQNDEDRNSCSICDSKFGWSKRKHHCRRCGRIVCSDCSPHRACASDVMMSGPARQVILTPPAWL